MNPPAASALPPSPSVLGAPPPEAPWVLSLVPARLQGVQVGGLELWQWGGLLIGLLGGWLVGTLIASTAVGALSRLAARTVVAWDDLLVQSARRPARLLLAVLSFQIFSSQLGLPAQAAVVVGHISYTGYVVGFSWLLLGAVNAGSSFYEGSLADDTAGELRSRSIRTRLTVARSVASVLLMLSSCAVLLMQFEVVRNVGVSLLASAGVAGVVLGFAAQKSLGGVIAGIQLSVAQPVRIGDLVQYEGELGTIEEINLTYIVMKLWDERRLVIPISKFIETTVQNWSKGELQLLGTVVVHADPTVPVELVRAELMRLCEAHKLWDKRKAVLQVTDTSPESISLRALVSARPDDLFDLRCDVREGLVAFLKNLDGGSFLPRRRWLDVQPGPAAGPAGPADAHP